MNGGDKRESPDSSAQSKSPRTLRNSMHGNRETSGASAPETAADRREKAQGRTPCMHAPEESDQVKYRRVARSSRVSAPNAAAEPTEARAHLLRNQPERDDRTRIGLNAQNLTTVVD